MLGPLDGIDQAREPHAAAEAQLGQYPQGRRGPLQYRLVNPAPVRLQHCGVAGPAPQGAQKAAFHLHQDRGGEVCQIGRIQGHGRRRQALAEHPHLGEFQFRHGIVGRHKTDHRDEIPDRQRSGIRGRHGQSDLARLNMKAPVGRLVGDGSLHVHAGRRVGGGIEDEQLVQRPHGQGEGVRHPGDQHLHIGRPGHEQMDT